MVKRLNYSKPQSTVGKINASREYIDFDTCKLLIDYIYSLASKHNGLRFSGFKAMSTKYSKRLYNNGVLARTSYDKLVRAHNELQELIDSQSSTHPKLR